MEAIDSSTQMNSDRTKKPKILPMLGLIGLGQAMCLSYSCFGVFNKILDENNLPIHNTTIFFTTVVNLTLFFSDCSKIPSDIKTPNCYLFLCAILQTSSYYLTMLAYQYTTIASNDLLQTFGIFIVAILSTRIFKIRYGWIHYLAMVITVIGMFATISDQIFNPNTSYSTQYLLGDLFAFAATVIYAIDLVIYEKLLSQGIPPFAYMAYVSRFSVILAIILFFATLEFEVYEQFQGNWLLLLYQIPLIAFCVVNVILIVFFINLYGATAFSIMSLSGVLYSMLFDIFFFNSPFKYQVVIGYGIIILAVVLFHLKEPTHPKQQHRELIDVNMEEVSGVTPSK